MTAPSTPRTDELLTLGAVHLRVTDAPRAARFWQEVVGLTPIAAPPEATVLGADDRPLVVLRETASRPATAGHSGLYHLAVHLPTEVEFARVLARLSAVGWPASAVDHLFSQAIYLRDPDGIGVELALETPWRMREMGVDDRHGLYAVDHDGQYHSPSEPLDVPALLAVADGTDLAAPADGAFIGHVHLSVPQLGPAVAFHRDQLGLIEHLNAPALGFADLHAGGAFTHRIALNTFHGRSAPATPPTMAGMDRYAVRYDTPQRLAGATSRLERAGIPMERGDAGALTVRDPGGNRVELSAPAGAR
jgi:catechol 2,3-dioxygenase